jgi:LAO/AO transport system kinase
MDGSREDDSGGRSDGGTENLADSPAEKLSESPEAPGARPEWTPAEGGPGFASRLLPGGGAAGHDGNVSHRAANGAQTAHQAPTTRAAARGLPTAQQYAEGVLTGDRAMLGRAITLVESNAPVHRARAQEVLRRLLPHAGRAIRVGITGVPGVGKSTFIEALGAWLLEQGHRLAVLAIDPSSARTAGSILGDKTRMEKLGRDPRCFIRPSPTGGTLGGVARKTRETMLVCEAAGYDVVLVETVGVGQSEITVRSLVDFFLLLLLPGGGDELQGIKRGIVEIADALLINKADGEGRPRAEVTRQEYDRALHYLMPARADWRPPVAICSALTGEGVPEAWSVVERFREQTQESGAFEQQRREQALGWLRALVDEHLRDRFYAHPGVARALPDVEQRLAEGTLPATSAVTELIEIYERDAPSSAPGSRQDTGGSGEEEPPS